VFSLGPLALPPDDPSSGDEPRKPAAGPIASLRASARAAWASATVRVRPLRTLRVGRRLLGVSLVGVLAVLAALALVVTRKPSPAAPSPGPSAVDLGPMSACDSKARASAPYDQTPGRISARLDASPLAEVLRGVGVEPAEVYRVRRALESIPGFVGAPQGRFVATRTVDSGVIQAFQIRTPTWTYRAHGDPSGQLVAERTTEAPQVRFCTGVLYLSATIEESVVASSFESDLAPLLAAALAGRVDPSALPPGSEVRVIAREVEALGGFAGYDGLAAIELRSAAGPPLRIYGLRGESEVSYVDGDGHPRPAPAAQPTEPMPATWKATRSSLDRALEAFAPAAPPLSLSAAAGEPSGDAPADEEPRPASSLDALEDREPPVRDDPSRTVAQAAKASCSTRIVAGLSRQIVAEARCLNADAFARIPARKNLQASSNVFLFLEAPARDHLLRALDKNPGRTMTVNSALRTVAQQVLLSKWGETKRCGVKLAASPSESNHESGLALDVQEASAWRKALESEGFKWMGRKDPVHFDYAGAGAVDHRGLDVRAFQRLWNRNNRDDVVGETGKLDPKTKQRLLRSPASGFAVGARCSG